MELNLKAIRKEKGLTQEELATAVGATKRQIGAWERGENDMPIDYAIEIANVLDCTIDGIAGRTTYAVVPLPDDSGLFPDEREVIELYRKLSEEGKRALLVLLRNNASEV